MVRRCVWGGAAAVCVAATTAAAATIDTHLFDRPWPHEWAHRYEVGRHMVDWRQGGSRATGTFACAQATVPLPQETMWELSSDFPALGRMTPAIKAVRILDQQPTHQIIEVDLHVFWKDLRLTFEVDRQPPRAMQFRLLRSGAGHCQGVCLLTENPTASLNGKAMPATTTVELFLWVKPTRRISTRLLLFVERTTILQGVKGFLAACDARDPAILSTPRQDEHRFSNRRAPNGNSAKHNL